MSSSLFPDAAKSTEACSVCNPIKRSVTGGNITVALKKEFNNPTVFFSMMITVFEKVFIWQAAKREGRITQLTVR
ncbi:hypothetical protein C2U51_10650 [Enterobacteriaceae bacterium ENNIH1]|nr:hypothetical protein C2U51_10650 [Enterobacteriaceae bacterium ENNIH1]